MSYLLAIFGLWLIYKVLVGFRLLVRGITKLRFSLESMMTLTLVGGACAALLMNPDNQVVFSLGIASTMVAAGFLVSYLIILGIYEKDQPYLPKAVRARLDDGVAVQSEICVRQPAGATPAAPVSAPKPASPPHHEAAFLAGIDDDTYARRLRVRGVADEF